MLVPSAAQAMCVPVPPGDNRAENLANARALTLCRVQELSDATALKAQQLQVQADLEAQARSFEQQLRMQQTYAAAQPPAVSLPPF
ncbi:MULTISPECIES: hypothetical protein [unclassified Devosia]|uniref:hypothetical protein n=1 Tax=unclassified Devosia TaxID=196773 RepID=UPI001AC39543|nr:MULTISPECIES: hypothetical protein [unclassified Devosia]MBN9305058.1 hypothetical protein [Devosia sp.]